MTAPAVRYRLAWAALAIICLVDTAWIVLTPIVLHPESLQTIELLAVATMVMAMLARWSGAAPRLYAIVMGITFLSVAWPALRLFNHLMMTLPIPLADARLAAWDQLIGFNWHGYLGLVDRFPMLLRAMDLSYWNLTSYSITLFLLLACGREADRRCHELVVLFLGTALTCTIIGAAFPAVAPMGYYAPAPGSFENIAIDTGTQHIASLMSLRTNPAHVLELANLPGLTTFPSFHTAMGIVAVYCARGTRLLFLPFLVVNGIMIASTPILGAHYGVDILGGAAAATLAILTYRNRLNWLSWTRNAELGRATATSAQQPA